MNQVIKKIKRTAKPFIIRYFYKQPSFTSGMNIVCFGDSTTQCGHLNKADRWPYKLQQKLNEWRPGYYHVYNKGRNGDTTTDGISRFPYQVLSPLPSLMLAQFGFNDAKVPPWASISRVSLEEYRRNLREFHRAALAHKSQCVFIVNHPIGAVKLKHPQGNGKSYNENFAPYNHTVREIATELAAPSIDLSRIIEKQKIPQENLTNENGLHLSRVGSHLYADIVFTALVPILSNITQAEGNPASEIK